MKNNSIYKKQYLLFLILLFSFYSNLAKAVENKPSLGFKNERILTYLQENNIIKGSIASKQAKTINSNSDIIFVESQEGNENFSYAIKIYSNNAGDFYSEKSLINSNLLINFSDIIEEYKTKNATKLPILIKYYAAIENTNKNLGNLIVMEKAPGTALNDSNSFPTSLKEAVSIGEEIGTQMGHLTKAFFEKNRSILYHGDPAVQNYIYDFKNKQLYWIDIGQIKEISIDDENEIISYSLAEELLLRPIIFKFFPQENQIRDLREVEEMTKRNKVKLSDFVLDKYYTHSIIKKQQLGICAVEVLYKTYYDIVKDLSVNMLPIERSLTKYFEKKKQEYKDKIISMFGEEDGNSFIKALLIDQPEACKIRAIDYSL